MYFYLPIAGRYRHLLFFTRREEPSDKQKWLHRQHKIAKKETTEHPIKSHVAQICAIAYCSLSHSFCVIMSSWITLFCTHVMKDSTWVKLPSETCFVEREHETGPVVWSVSVVLVAKALLKSTNSTNAASGIDMRKRGTEKKKTLVLVKKKKKSWHRF